jgi:hypothetical protein
MRLFWSIVPWPRKHDADVLGIVRQSLARRLRMFGCPLLASGLLGTDLHASQPTPLPSHSAVDHPVLRDTKSVLRARQALFEDPLLTPYNLGVEVRDDIAILSGTLPSADLVPRALERVRKLCLFNDVRSQLVVDANCGAPTHLSGVAPTGPEDVLSSIANPRPHAPSELTGRQDAPVRIPALKPPESVTPSNIGATSSRPLDEAVTLLPPRPIAAPNAPLKTGAEILPPRPIIAKDPSDAIEQLHRSETRYQALQIRVREGVVTIRGPASGEEVYAFAQAIRQIPGVVRVVLQPAP